jgi:nucleoside-diphosphate-sugar epimerase
MGSILITGSSGFIGNRTAQLLLEQGNEVIGIDNMNDYYDIRLKQYRLKNLQKFDQFRFYQVDIENIKELEKIFAEHHFDSIINLAARAGVRYSIENPHVYMTTNADGTLNILEMMRKYEIKKMVLASSSSLYAMQPMPSPKTFRETLRCRHMLPQKKRLKLLRILIIFFLDLTLPSLDTLPCMAPQVDRYECVSFYKMD